MRHYHFDTVNEDGTDWGVVPYVPFDGWRRAFDKEHLCFNTKEPPKPLVKLCHGYEYLIYDTSTGTMCVSVWTSNAGWDGGCGCAHPDQLVHCLPEVPDHPEELK